MNVIYLTVRHKKNCKTNLYEKHLAGDKSGFAVTFDEALIYEYEKLNRLEFAMYHVEKPYRKLSYLKKVKVSVRALL